MKSAAQTSDRATSRILGERSRANGNRTRDREHAAAWSCRNITGPVVASLFCTLLAILCLSPTASAGDYDNSTGNPVPGANLSPRSVADPSSQSIATPAWTVSVGGIVLGRLGGANRVLDARVPGSVPFLATFITPGVDAFNSNQLQQGVSAGPKIGLTYHNDSGFGVELVYFNVFDQDATRSIGPDSPADWLVMRAPGGFWQTQDFPYQAMTWNAATNLYSAELNGRFDLSRRVAVFAGFRWFRLDDNLQGSLNPPDRTEPTWKKTCPLCNLFQVTPDGSTAAFPPFWNTGTTNNLYGVQLGIAGKILEVGRFAIEARATVGLFDNDATQSTGVSIEKIVYPAAATANGLAFASEASLQLKYRVTGGLSLSAGYEVLWLDGVALAPRQIDETYAAPSDVRVLGINHGSNVLFQGATFGLEYSF